MESTGKPLHVLITPGQQHESTVADVLMDFIHGAACIADGGYDSDRIIEEARQRKLKVVIPSGICRKHRRRCDPELYSLRYLVECFFHKLKRFRRVATRYDKTACCYGAFLHVACALQWLQ